MNKQNRNFHLYMNCHSNLFLITNFIIDFINKIYFNNFGIGFNNFGIGFNNFGIDFNDFGIDFNDFGIDFNDFEIDRIDYWIFVKFLNEMYL